MQKYSKENSRKFQKLNETKGSEVNGNESYSVVLCLRLIFPGKFSNFPPSTLKGK
jgi:hypothetical protein